MSANDSQLAFCSFFPNQRPAPLHPLVSATLHGKTLSKLLFPLFGEWKLPKLTGCSSLGLKYTVSQSFSTAYSIVGHGEAGAYLQQSMGERRDTPWTCRQSIAG
ncbi:hypothetical protein AMECASPLE_036033 [Ameca splendens]|uniref:Uncharacterized protein n=1 Tax=Ameca splendens TaxID=208324 RepID=A0ABV0XKL2_9TELE